MFCNIMYAVAPIKTLRTSRTGLLNGSDKHFYNAPVAFYIVSTNYKTCQVNGV